jgi:hypothetical protein
VTRVVQHETGPGRDARRKRCEEILAGNLRSIEFVSDLDLHNLQLGDETLAKAIARVSELPGIKRLRIGFNVLRADAMKALATSALSARLEELDLTGNQLGDLGTAALFAGNFPCLGQLQLGWCRLTDGAAPAIAEAFGMPMLRELSLRRNEFTDGGAAILAASARLRAQLTRIDFDYNDETTRRGMNALRRAFGAALVV